MSTITQTKQTILTLDSIITQELLDLIKPSPCFPGDTDGTKFFECKFQTPVYEYYANSYTREIQGIRFSIGKYSLGQTIKEILISYRHNDIVEQADSYTFTI
jgi:hypothetical protein